MRKVYVGRDLKTALLVHELIGKEVTICDQRTGSGYRTLITGAKESFGNLRITIDPEYLSVDGVKWFEPSYDELKSIGNPGEYPLDSRRSERMEER